MAIGGDLIINWIINRTFRKFPNKSYHEIEKKIQNKTRSTFQLEKQYGGKVEFGKVDTELNELQITVPSQGLVRVHADTDGQVRQLLGVWGNFLTVINV